MADAANPPKKFRPEPFGYHEIVELDIDSLSNLGAGVGRVDSLGKPREQSERNWVVFVPFSLPGERIKARIWKNEASCSHGDLVEIIHRSPSRRQPRCSLFTSCGGCQYQHLDYQEQLGWKQHQVSELLERMAGIRHPVENPIPSPQPWNYRSKITPHFQKPRPDRDLNIGFLAAGSRNRIIDVPQCAIAMTILNKALPEERTRIRQT